MATLAGAAPSTSLDRERSFFFLMSLLIAATVVGGFSFHLAMGRSTFASPWWVHVHGLTFMGWMGIYVAQNFRVWRGETTLHKRLGVLAALYVGWMMIVGLSVNTLSAINHRIPPFFEPNVFLVMDWTVVLVFAGLTFAAVRKRAQSDWHRRLMLCGAVQIMLPGVGRLLPTPLMGKWAILAFWAVMFAFMAVAMLRDIVARGKIHPAYFWGLGAITIGVALMRPIAFSPPMLALTAYLMG
jgi:hypothetical protein